MKKILTLVIVSLLFLSLAVLPSNAAEPEEETSFVSILWNATVAEIREDSGEYYIPAPGGGYDPDRGWWSWRQMGRFNMDFGGHVGLEAHWVTFEGFKSISHWTISDFQTYGFAELWVYWTYLNIGESPGDLDGTGEIVEQTLSLDYEISASGIETIREAALQPFVINVPYLYEFFLGNLMNIESVCSATGEDLWGGVIDMQIMTPFPIQGAPSTVPFDETTQTFWTESHQQFLLYDPWTGAALPIYDMIVHWSVEVTPLLFWPAPEIEEIIVTGFPDANNPMTDDPSTFITEKVNFEAKITPSGDFEVTRVSWSGDLEPGEGNPYETRYAPGTHGKKRVVCTIFYRNLFTGETGENEKTKEFKVFFVKGDSLELALVGAGSIADEDGDGDPNWFEYWKKALGGSARLEYWPFVNWGRASARGVEIGDNAGFGPPPRHNITNIKTNIDCFYCVMMHELRHLVDIQYVVATYGSLATIPPANDSDNDSLPNERDPFPNTVNGAGYPEYTGTRAWVGDWEYRARQVEDVTADANLDWANPGKQSDGVARARGDSIAKSTGEFGYLDQLGLAEAELTGSYSDYGTDTDGDGLYNYLTVELEVNVTAAGNCTVIGGLEGDDYTLWARNHTHLDIGVQNVRLNFDGSAIRQHRADGPYQISLTLGIEDWINFDKIFDTYSTSPYEYTDFQRASSEFTNNYSDYGVDTDGDGLYDYLTVEVEVNSINPESYTIQAWLYDSTGNDITSAANSTLLGVGSQTIKLNFDGFAINRHRADGPYNLRYLSLSGSSQVDFIYDAYNTSAYSYTDFQKTDAAFTGAYSDYGKDTDGDGRYDYLTVEVEIDVSTSGNYVLVGWLYDNTEAEMVMASSNAYLDAGSQTVQLDFDGVSIYDHGVDGPYDLKYLTLYDENGALMDTLNYAYTTATYNYAQFQQPVARAHVDIKPGSWQNPLNLKSKGVLPVAVCGTEDFDVATIDPETIRLTLEGVGVGVTPLRWSYEDVATPYEGEPCSGHDIEGDGYLDLTLKFKTQEVIATLGLKAFSDRDVVILTLAGNLKAEHGGTPIQGQDCVVILKK